MDSDDGIRRGILCVALGLTLLGADALEPRTLSVDEIVTRHVEALGGMAAVLAVHSFVRHVVVSRAATRVAALESQSSQD
jgi:hypothetical protein